MINSPFIFTCLSVTLHCTHDDPVKSSQHWGQKLDKTFNSGNWDYFVQEKCTWSLTCKHGYQSDIGNFRSTGTSDTGTTKSRTQTESRNSRETTGWETTRSKRIIKSTLAGNARTTGCPVARVGGTKIRRTEAGSERRNGIVKQKT